MKRLIKLLAAIAIVLIGALTTIAVINRYEEYKLTQKAKDNAAVSQQLDRAEVIKQQLEADKAAALGKLNAECQKGLAAYNLLTPAQKTKVAAPVCDAV